MKKISFLIVLGSIALGQPVSAGVYLYSIETKDFRQTKKMILLK